MTGGADGGGGGGEVPGAERVAASTAAQRADAFIDGIIMPVLDNKLLPTSGGAPATVCHGPAGAVAEPTAAADNGDVAERLADGTLRLGSASIRATNGVGESFISSLAALELSCDANVQRIVMTPAGKALDIGRKTR